MEALKEMAKRCKRLDENKVLRSIYANKDLQEWILDLNRHDQLFEKSINSLGVSLSEIGGGYSAQTEALSGDVAFYYSGTGRFKKTGDAPFLYDTGEFYRSFRFRILSDGFEIDANPIKEDTNLFSEWGEDILGLTPESRDKLTRILIPLIQKRVLQYITEGGKQ